MVVVEKWRQTVWIV